MKPRHDIQSIDMLVQVDIGRMLVTATFPNRRRLVYRIHINPNNGWVWPALMPHRSDPVQSMGIQPESPQMLETIANHWHGTMAGAGKQMLHIDIREHTTRDGAGQIIPLPSLTPQEQAGIASLITLDTDHDGLLDITVEQWDARIREMGAMLTGRGEV